MCGKKSKSGLLLLVLLLLLSSARLSADRILTEEEYNELMNLQTTQEEQLIQQQKTIDELQTELTASKTELIRVKSWSKMQDEIIETLSQLIDDLKKSLEMQKSGPSLGIEGGATYDSDGPGVYFGLNLSW